MRGILTAAVAVTVALTLAGCLPPETVQEQPQEGAEGAYLTEEGMQAIEDAIAAKDTINAINSLESDYREITQRASDYLTIIAATDIMLTIDRDTVSEESYARASEALAETVRGAADETLPGDELAIIVDDLVAEMQLLTPVE